MTTEVFGHLPGGQAAVERIRLQDGPLSAQVLTLGAIVQDLRLEGVPHPLVLGADSLGPYLGPMQYFGALVGRCTNRIGAARFVLDGQSYHVSANFRGRHCLHGGARGSFARMWSVRARSASSVVLCLQMADDEMGFPGTLDVVLTITLDDTAISFDIRATTDRNTICNLSHHGYFTLDDGGSLADHSLRVAAARYLPVDDDLIPTGEVAPVDGTAYDFRTARNLRDVALDHNFCLSDRRVPLRPVAWLQASGLSMRVETTEPGLQVYTATHLPEPGVLGLEGRHYGRHAGIALEGQVWPDAPNRPQFPSARLDVDQVYHHQTRYVFAREPVT